MLPLLSDIQIPIVADKIWLACKLNRRNLWAHTYIKSGDIFLTEVCLGSQHKRQRYRHQPRDRLRQLYTYRRWRRTTWSPVVQPIQRLWARIAQQGWLLLSGRTLRSLFATRRWGAARAGMSFDMCTYHERWTFHTWIVTPMKQKKSNFRRQIMIW